MRTINDILCDVCISFDSTIDEFNSRNKKRPTEHMSLITYAFIYIALSTQCINMQQIAKLINRTPSSICIAKQKAFQLVASNNLYAANFKQKIYESCIEGKQSLTKNQI